ncbi:T7SS effector LXG polymorphic toxin [Carnobacterium gallinarum]|uniref:T7SS effector LXG polymorphic toxin n=1 Tax=Carnobacterium gallinarum TaxID=2749 RepID=UPI0005578961|nr:T7SS effector LXG polymorphic toxin [Carnobacterium gallinarum]
MSINVYVGELQTQLEEITRDSQNTIQVMEEIQKSLNAIIIEPSLTGLTYDSMKNYFKNVYLPVTKGFILVSETMITSNQTLLNRYLEEVDVNDLQEHILEARIKQYNHLSQMLDSLEDKTGLVDKMIDNMQEMSIYTTRKLDELREFDYFSIQIADELDAQLAELEIGVGILMDGKAWNQSTGTFSTLGLNLEWAGTINRKWEDKQKKKE